MIKNIFKLSQAFFFVGLVFCENQSIHFLDNQQRLKENLGIAIRQGNAKQFLTALIEAKDGGIEDNILREVIKRTFVDEMYLIPDRQFLTTMLAFLQDIEIPVI